MTLSIRKISEVAHNALPHIDDVSALDESDLPCLQELRDVLKKHGREERFGVTLLHKHFELSDDECLLEETDTEQRFQVISVKKKSEITDQTIGTVWRLGDTPSGVLSCARECFISYQGQHKRDHVTRSGG